MYSHRRTGKRLKHYVQLSMRFAAADTTVVAFFSPLIQGVDVKYTTGVIAVLLVVNVILSLYYHIRGELRPR